MTLLTKKVMQAPRESHYSVPVNVFIWIAMWVYIGWSLGRIFK